MTRRTTHYWFIATVVLLLAAFWGPAAEAHSAPLSGRTIVVDPGHGGSTGATGVNGVKEDQNNLSIALKLKPLLEAAGARVVLTRDGDYVPSRKGLGQLASRTSLANDLGADLFISIHQNSVVGYGGGSGLITYYAWGENSRRLARSVHGAILRRTGLKNLKVQSRGVYVLRETRMPAILIEGGFLSNPEEARLISSDAFHAKEARAIYEGVLAYYGISPSQVDLGSTAGALRPAGSAAVDLTINGKPFTVGSGEPLPYFDTRSDRTMVPARFLSETLGAKVTWFADRRQVEIVKNGRRIVLTIGSRVATLDGQSILLDTPAVLFRGRTFVPVRFLAEAFGAEVAWNQAQQRVLIMA